jgi:copper homeostasis protein
LGYIYLLGYSGMAKLEVIVTSAAEAVVAAAGGADRLELVRALDTGGLTPAWETVWEVSQSVSIPVRVMLRENASMAVADGDELKVLAAAAAKLQELAIDGLVMGWVTDRGAVDEASLETVLAAAEKCKITFHRAFEHLADPLEGLKVLKGFKQIDRILTGGGSGAWAERRRRLHDWSAAASPEIGILVGGGLSDEEVAELMAGAEFPEVHVGRAARIPQQNDGVLDAGKIALLKSRRGQ